MLKPLFCPLVASSLTQPPSGGCVLKHAMRGAHRRLGRSAAFGRLCVETFKINDLIKKVLSAAFGRLCVETWFVKSIMIIPLFSRLRAAVC